MRSVFEKISAFFNLKNTLITALCFILIVAVVLLCLFTGGDPKPTQTQNESSSPTLTLTESDTDTSSDEEVSSELPEIELQITAPTKDNVTTVEPTYTLSGTSDPDEELKLNGESVKRNSDGSFSIIKDLKVGKNTFKFEHKGKIITKTVTYNYIVIKSYSPSGAKTYSSGSVISVSVTARKSSTVKATFNGKTITCKEADIKDDEDGGAEKDDTFVNYSGTFTLPNDNATQLNLGKIKFTASCNGVTNTKYSGDIKVEKSSIINSSDPSVTPSGGDYINVGSGLIATIVSRSAETFNANVIDDDSRTYNNYLPEGTQDYCAEGTVTYQGKEYYKLRCGRRVYKTTYIGKSYEQTVATTSVGTLPDHNELEILSFTDDGKYSTLTLKSDWKAPFYFELKNQSYSKTRFTYSISSVTFTYVDITFCYATVFEGEINIPDDHPVFKDAEIIKNEYDTTLRLYLKKTGGFYGWDCHYDSSGNLVFEFLNPAKMENSDSLNGITIYLDVGHGGADVGAVVGATNERNVNLMLAQKIRSRLEEKGATVIMNRTDNSTEINPENRINALRDSDADLCVAIHHDISTKSSPNGFFGAYFTPFSYQAANYVWQQTASANIYKTMWDLEAHYYYVARVTSCPVILTENGFLSNSLDYEGIISEEITDKKADAIVAGVVDYFKYIQ